MLRENNKRKAMSTMEYVILIVMIISVLLVMRKPIARVFFGRWKSLGDGFSQGQQYDPTLGGTVECGRYVPRNATGNGWGSEVWFSYDCYACCIDTNKASCTYFAGGSLSICRNKPDDKAKGRCCIEGCAAGSGAVCNFEP